jgi:protein involved in ribonucleotide reduction
MPALFRAGCHITFFFFRHIIGRSGIGRLSVNRPQRHTSETECSNHYIRIVPTIAGGTHDANEVDSRNQAE